ncbi:phospholipase D family protein [Thiotrichales bacterium HSG1]|nr:phospholipase D family protein [Thiotrichales bacterium HSG1]
MKHKFLPNSNSIRKSISELFFEENDEKYAVVAFVGRNAIDYLPNKKNITVICWPKAGGTSPEGIRRLLNAGIDVKFCDSLHSKIFWCKNKGMIISSANLSDNALGDSGLIEYGVMIFDRNYNFHKEVLKKLQLRKVTKEELDSLDINSNKFNRTNSFTTNTITETYSEWFQRKYKQKWKIVWYSETSKADDTTKNEVLRRFGKDIKWKYNDVEVKKYQEGDLVFQFRVDANEEFIPRANGVWFYVDMVTSTKKIVQVDKLANITVPFKIDSCFRKSFKQALSELGWDMICDDESYPKSEFLKLVYNYFGT